MARKKSKSEAKTEAVADEVKDAEDVVELDEPSQENLTDLADVEDSAEHGISDQPDELPSDADAEVEVAEPAEEGVSEDEETQPTPAEQPEAVKIVERKGGFIPMVLGGVVAGGLGYGAATYIQPADSAQTLVELTAKLEAQADELKALRGELDSQSGGAEALAKAQEQLTVVGQGLKTVEADLQDGLAKLDGFESRIGTLEKAPLAEASPEAVAAYEKELEAFRASLEEQRAEVEAIAASAEEKREAAEAAAQDARVYSALSEIQTSLETGSDFGAAVTALAGAGVDVPEALKSQSGGVPTVKVLTESFAPAARKALAAARKETGGSGGFGSFLKTQLGARSIAPREGDDPDAVLSRMEAAAKDGQFDAVLSEAEALPETAKAPLSQWLENAQNRKAAVDAVDALSQKINSN